MSFNWLSAHDYLFARALMDLVVGVLLYRFTTSRPKLTYYISHTPWIRMNPPQQQVPPAPGPLALPPQNAYIGAGSLFLWNGGKLAAQQVEIGHYGALPFYGVLPDVQRNVVNLPGGGVVIQFPHVPPKTLITISYLFHLPATGVQDLISYVRSEDGPAERIPVALLRVFPKWVQVILFILIFGGLWFFTKVLLELPSYLMK
jgi:hypothetical protein